MRKIIVLTTAVVMVIAMASQVVANVQLAVDRFTVDDVFYAVGENIITGDPIINPTMSVSWEDPESWANDDEIHSPTYYELVVTNKTMDTEETILILENTTEFDDQNIDLHNEMNLETGSFYEMTIQPFHYHEVTSDGETYNELASSAQEPEKAYAVTDLNVEFISGEDSIQVIWDDLGELEFNYRIVYAVGDYTSSSKDELFDNKEGEITGLSIDSDDVTSYYDTLERRYKLAYTLDESIYPGQVYSIIVEPVAEYYNSYTVERNRNYPYIQSVSTDISLSLVEDGDYLRLQWDIPSSFQVGQDQNEYSLVEATLMEYQDGVGRNLVIFDGDAAAIGYYRVNKPIWETEYQLTLVYRAIDDSSKPDIGPESNILGYVPSDYLIQPTKPYVPEVISDRVLDDLKAQYELDDIYPILEEFYLVKGYSYGAALDDLMNEDVTFHVDAYNTSINFVWGAFQRIDVDQTSPTYGEYIYDNNVYYDVWVTDELSTLAYAPTTLGDVRYNSTTDSHVIVNGEEDIIGFKQQFNFYYDTDTNEVLEIVPNDIYYIMVQAKKVTARGTLLSEPTITTIYYTYGGDAFSPPTIAKPPLEVKDSETTETGVTLIWKETWYEAISPDLAHPDILGNWQHEVWVDDDGVVYNETIDDGAYFALFEGEGEIQRLRDHLEDLGFTYDIISRQVDLGTDDFGVSDVQYKFLPILYETVQDRIEEGLLIDDAYSFEEYFNELIGKDKDGTAPQAWQNVTPYSDPDNHTNYVLRQEGLKENTSYLFILYPFRTLQSGEILYAHYPTPIIVSTLPEVTIVTPDPTVPSVYAISATDSSITATWKYNTDFTYKLMYGLNEDVTEADSVPIVLPDNTLDPDYPQDGDYYEVVVDDLFPLSTYYFWVKATQSSNGSTSLWSNPVIGNTLDVHAPLPPRGLGLAPTSVIELYGFDQNMTEDYIIIEWLKDLNDVNQATDNRVEKTYTYIIEVADNAKFIDPIYIQSSGNSEDIVPENVEILEKNLVKINGLIGNRQYYIRAKTTLVVTGTENGQYITKESTFYTDPIRLITLSNGDEYDGTIDPALTLLPQEDYELIYNDVSNSLEFRFRTNEEDKEGQRDNQVDQRLISSLIEDQVHEYVIDLTSFSDQEIERRRVTIPYTILEAFDAYDVDIRILADHMNFEVATKGVMGAVEEQVMAYGVAPSLVIDMEDIDSDEVMATLPEVSLKAVTVPQELQMNVRSRRKSDALYYTDTPMTLELSTNTRYEVYDQDLALYMKDHKSKWSLLEGAYNHYDALMIFETAQLGSYGLYTYDRSGSMEGHQNTTHWSETFRKDIFSQITIEGLSNYNPEAQVSEKAMVQATYGTVMDLPNIDLTESLDQQSLKTMLRAGIKDDVSQTGTSISREEAISMFVRTAEIVGGQTVAITVDDLSAAQNVSGVDGAYAVAIAKAKVMGLVTDLKTLRANDALTYGEYFTLWSRALD